MRNRRIENQTNNAYNQSEIYPASTIIAFKWEQHLPKNNPVPRYPQSTCNQKLFSFLFCRMLVVLFALTIVTLDTFICCESPVNDPICDYQPPCPLLFSAHQLENQSQRHGLSCLCNRFSTALIAHRQQNFIIDRSSCHESVLSDYCRPRRQGK